MENNGQDKPVKTINIRAVCNSLDKVIGGALVTIILAVSALMCGAEWLAPLLVAVFFLWVVRKSGEARRQELAEIFPEDYRE